MPDSFVPLTASVAAPAHALAPSLRVRVVPEADATTAFVPLRRPGTNGHACAPAGGAPAAAPSVTFERDGERIKKIRIRCACGQTMELDCVY